MSCKICGIETKHQLCKYCQQIDELITNAMKGDLLRLASYLYNRVIEALNKSNLESYNKMREQIEDDIIRPINLGDKND